MVKYSEGLSINVKLFADDTSLFPVIHDSETFANVLNKDLDMIHNWVFQWNILTQTLPNKLKKSFLVVKQKNYLILLKCLIMQMLINISKHLSIIS